MAEYLDEGVKSILFGHSNKGLWKMLIILAKNIEHQIVSAGYEYAVSFAEL